VPIGLSEEVADPRVALGVIELGSINTAAGR
jgi:hypothetical protein